MKKIYYKTTNIFVLPVLSEDFGLVLLEAGANRLPLVVSDLPAMGVVVKDNCKDLMTKSNSSEDLTVKLLILLRNEAKCKKMVTSWNY
jgi:glycosyltransferase involved in cell wall biosynthesis